MIREIYSSREKEMKITVVQGKRESIRRKNVPKTGIRVYDNGKIGVAAGIGPIDENELTNEAISMLAAGIDYPWDVEQGKKKSISVDTFVKSDGRETNNQLNEHLFLDSVETLLDRLRADIPDISFSDAIKLSETLSSLVNDRDLDLRHSERKVVFSLSVKEKCSANIEDFTFYYEGNSLDCDGSLKTIAELCSAWRNKISLPASAKGTDGKMNVMIFRDNGTFFSKLHESLHGLSYGSGSSLLAGKAGSLLFSNELTVFQSRNVADGIHVPFFDAEGVFQPDFRYPLIQNGVFKTPYTSKKTADQFALPLTGAASGGYAGVPGMYIPPLVLAQTGKTMEQLLGGEPGIFINDAVGGSFTPNGEFATPVQAAFLHDGKRLIGRLPELTVRGSFFDMFGKDFVGVSVDSPYSLDHCPVAAIRMQVEENG